MAKDEIIDPKQDQSKISTVADVKTNQEEKKRQEIKRDDRPDTRAAEKIQEVESQNEENEVKKIDPLPAVKPNKESEIIADHNLDNKSKE